MNRMLDATQETTLKLKDIKPEEAILLRDVLWILKEVPCRQALVYVHLTLDFVYSFKNYLWIPCNVPGINLATWDTSMDKTVVSVFHRHNNM